MFIVLPIIPISINNIVLTKVIAEMSERPTQGAQEVRQLLELAINPRSVGFVQCYSFPKLELFLAPDFLCGDLIAT